MAGPSILDAVEQSLSPTKVGIEEFCESSDFCGKHLYPRQLVLLKLIFLEEMTGPEEDVLDYWIAGGRNGTEISISPNIRERVTYLRERGYPHFREVDLVGGRRSSKGFMTGLCLAKVMFDCLNLQDPGEHYGIDPEKDIYFSCVAGSESQAKQFQYADFSTTVENCKAMEPYIIKSLETEIRVASPADLVKIQRAKARGNRIQKDIAKLRGNALAANAGTLRGSATMVFVVDEVAHMIPGESKASASEVYKAATPSLDQFGLDGMAFLNSSPYTKIGLFYERVQAAFKPFLPNRETVLDDPENGNGDPLSFAFQFPSWAAYDGYKGYTSKRRRTPYFKAITVSPDWDENEKDADGEELWSIADQRAIEQARLEEAANPDSYKVERRGKFSEVIDAFLNPGQVDRMFMGIPTEWAYGVNGDAQPVYSQIATNWGKGVTNLYRYKFHLDPSSTTAGFGFAIGHVEHFLNAQGLEEEHVVFDLLKRWNPANFEGKVIRWNPIIEEVLGYAETFRPFEITMDQHNCLNGDTLISTAGGLRTLTSLGEGLEVGESKSLDILVQSKDGRATATSIYRRGPSPTRVLTLKTGYPIEATLDHRLWVRKQKVKEWHKPSPWQWMKVEDIAVGDYLCIRKNSIMASEEVDVTLYHKVGVGSSRFVGVSRCGKRWRALVRQNNKPIHLGVFATQEEANDAVLEWRGEKSLRKGCLPPETCDQDMGELLGLMIAEGTVYPDNAKFGNSETAVLDAFTERAERVFGGEWKYERILRETQNPQGGVSEGYWGEHGFGGYISNMLWEFGCGGDAYKKSVPWIIQRSPKHVIAGFLRGYFEGDGWAVLSRANDEIVGINTRSEQLAKGVQQLLLLLGIYSTLHHGRTTEYKGEEKFEWRVKLFGLDILRFAEEVRFLCPRKNETLDKICEQILLRGDKVGKRSKLNRVGDDQYFRVTRIEDSTADCYDLSVPGPESFIANGVISHNSAEPIQDLQERLTIRNIPTRVYEKVATNELNWRRWQTFKTSLYQGRLHAPFDTPDCQLGALELKFLQEKNTGSRYPRVDRQEIGPIQTKDIADSLCEVTYSLIGNMMVNRARDRLSNSSLIGGSAGGYGIGRGPIGGIGPPGISEYYSKSGGRGEISNPARGVTGRGRGRSGGYRSRGR